MTVTVSTRTKTIRVKSLLCMVATLRSSLLRAISLNIRNTHAKCGFLLTVPIMAT